MRLFSTAIVTALLLHSGIPRDAWAAASQGATVSGSQTASRVVVVLPREDAELQLDDKAIPGEGLTRGFELPVEEPGRAAAHTLTARWRPNNYTLLTRTKILTVQAGEEVTVDLGVSDPGDRAEIRYVPTGDAVVQDMIALAQIGPGDVVYEPGCGDARITIAAVKAGASKGVGIDIDPERVSEAEENVRAAGLADRVAVRLGDALEIADLSEATVVFLYMGDEFDLLMRPLLWKQLRVGARVVSHRFTMGDWPPDRTISSFDGDGSYKVHLWTITEGIKKRAAAGNEFVPTVLEGR